MSATTTSAHDIGRALRRQLPGVGVTKLHKLLYYCQGWHLAWTGEPMVREDIEAWDMGPVVADLWHDEEDHQAFVSTPVERRHGIACTSGRG